MTDEQQNQLRRLPAIDALMTLAGSHPAFEGIPKAVVLRSARESVAALRQVILKNSSGSPSANTFSENDVMDSMVSRARTHLKPRLRPLINATGVVIHTNLGRSLLAREAMDAVIAVSEAYSNLEFDLSSGRRGVRYAAIEEILCEISGAEAAMAVNNNAGAVLLCLDTLAKGKEVVVSRGELIEIGGSFRIPDVMAKSGAALKEVGTTNRTHPKDYEAAITPDTALLLKVHASNFSIVGFTASVSVSEMVGIGKKHSVPVMEDLGSGNFLDLSLYGLLKEPTVQDSVVAGADIVTFSGDKLLGGPQAGLIVGKKSIISRIKANPLTRALRIDKLTLAALEQTLRLYRDPKQVILKIPTLRMLTLPVRDIRKKAEYCLELLENLKDRGLEINLIPITSRVGGGALPLQELPSAGLSISVRGISANQLERAFRAHDPAIIGRIDQDVFILDFRTVQESDISSIETALYGILETYTS